MPRWSAPLYLTARRTSTANSSKSHGGKFMVTTHPLVEATCQHWHLVRAPSGATIQHNGKEPGDGRLPPPSQRTSQLRPHDGRTLGWDANVGTPGLTWN